MRTKQNLRKKLFIVLIFFLNTQMSIIPQEDSVPKKKEEIRDKQQTEEETNVEQVKGASNTEAVLNNKEIKKTEDQKKTMSSPDAPSPGLNGFIGINWGTQYQDVKEKFRVLESSQDVTDPINILADTPGESLLIERGGIRYKFLFYLKKEPTMDDNSNILNQKNDENKTMDMKKMARFFFVSSELPFVPSETLYEKIKGKYGKHTSTTANKKRGAYIWDINNGAVIQWVESYKKQAYSRSIYYASKVIRAEIMQDLEAYQNYKELKAIENLIP